MAAKCWSNTSWLLCPAISSHPQVFRRHCQPTLDMWPCTDSGRDILPEQIYWFLYLWTIQGVTIGTFSLLFLNGLNTFPQVHLILSRHVIILSQGTLSLYLFSHEISISPMLSQLSFNFCAVHCYAYLSSLPFWCLTHHTCYASILCTAYLISAPTAQGLGFALCIQYR